MSIDQAKARFARVAFAEFLGVTILDVSDERAVLLLPHQPQHANAAGPLNGGASASLLQMAGAVAAWTGIDLDAEPHLSCVDMSVQYLSAAIQEDVVAEAQVLRRGRDLFFLHVALGTPEPEARPVCQGLMMYRAPDYADHEPRLRAQPHLLPAPALIPPDDPWLIEGYTQKLQMSSQHRSPGRTRMAMAYTPSHVDERGQMHEGALASIADVAGPAAAIAEAERLIAECKPNVAIVDIDLRDGELANPLLDRLRQEGIPVIVITRYTTAPMELGAVEAVLQKPVSVERFLAALGPSLLD
jgi:uncharacterized protein (TIGR00369 family)